LQAKILENSAPMLTNRITTKENATTTAAGFAPVPAFFNVSPTQPAAQTPLALQLFAMQQAYEQALQEARDQASQVIAMCRHSSLN